MAINLDAIKAKLNQIQQSANTGGGSKANDAMWKPPVGKSVIRVVPYAYDKSNPFIELAFHYEIGKRTMVSPNSFGRPDPIVEFSEKLKKTGDKDDWKLGKKIEPKFRVYAPVIVRGEEEKGVRFWSFGKQIYQELLGIITDPDYGDITDLMNGRDITIEHTAAEEGNNKSFPSFTVRVKPNITPATTDKEIAEAIVNGQKSIDDVVSELPYADMKEALEKWLNPEGGAAATGDSFMNDMNNPSSMKNSKSATKVEDVASAFDELFKK